MSYNCCDVRPYRYKDILKNHFPTSNRVKHTFWAMTLTEALDDTQSDFEIYLELNAFYNYSYMYDIENKSKQLCSLTVLMTKEEI